MARCPRLMHQKDTFLRNQIRKLIAPHISGHRNHRNFGLMNPVRVRRPNPRVAAYYYRAVSDLYHFFLTGVVVVSSYLKQSAKSSTD